MTGGKYDDKLGLDMPFGEALERFIGVDPAEARENAAKAKRKRPPGGRRSEPSGEKVEEPKVVRLRDRRKRNHV